MILRRNALAVGTLLGLILALHTPDAKATCQTHACWDRVHDQRVVDMTKRRIRAITPYGPCYGGKWAAPCWVIRQESKGRWNVLNTWTSGTPCLDRACGPYQFLGWNVPWPIESLRDKLKHHREARTLIALYGFSPW